MHSRVDLRWCYHSQSVSLEADRGWEFPPATRGAAVQLQRAVRMEVVDKLTCFCLKGAQDVSVKSVMRLKIILLPDLYQWKLSCGSLLANTTLMMKLKKVQVLGRSDFECRFTFSPVSPNRMNRALEWIQMLSATFGKSSVRKCRTNARWYSHPTGRAGLALSPVSGSAAGMERPVLHTPCWSLQNFRALSYDRFGGLLWLNVGAHRDPQHFREDW